MTLFFVPAIVPTAREKTGTAQIDNQNEIKEQRQILESLSFKPRIPGGSGPHQKLRQLREGSSQDLRRSTALLY